jgi:hypothetical protein
MPWLVFYHKGHYAGAKGTEVMSCSNRVRASFANLCGALGGLCGKILAVMPEPSFRPKIRAPEQSSFEFAGDPIPDEMPLHSACAPGRWN